MGFTPETTTVPTAALSCEVLCRYMKEGRFLLTGMNVQKMEISDTAYQNKNK